MTCSFRFSYYLVAVLLVVSSLCGCNEQKLPDASASFQSNILSQEEHHSSNYTNNSKSTEPPQDSVGGQSASSVTDETQELLKISLSEPKRLDGFLKEGYTCDSWQFYDDSSIIVLQYRDSDSYLTIYDFIKEQTVVETPLSSGMTDGRLRKLKQDEKTTYAVLSRVKGFAKNDYNNYQYDCYDSNLQIMDSTAIVFPEKAYLDGPTVVTDDKHILYEHSDTQKQKLYIADADGSNERLLLDTDKDFGGGFIWYIECRGDYFTFNTMGGAGIFHIPTEKYHHILGGFDTYLCDGGKQYITGNTYSGKLGTIPPMLYDATADTLTTYDKLNGGLFFGVSDNSRYLYDVGLIWPITDYCTINVFDRETEQLYTENFEPEGFSVLPDVQEENHNISDDGKYLIYPSRNGQFLLLEVKWENNANHLPSDTK